MTYQIDQSGKVEDTNKLTVVAYANGRSKSVKIGSAEKQKLLKVMRELDFPKRNYIYKIFAALVYVLLVDENIDSIVIDHEYVGHEATIKGIIIQLLSKNGKNVPQIRFDYIGKWSNAHKAAINVYRGNEEADLIVTAKDILRLLY